MAELSGWATSNRLLAPSPCLKTFGLSDNLSQERKVLANLLAVDGRMARQPNKDPEEQIQATSLVSEYLTPLAWSSARLTSKM